MGWVALWDPGTQEIAFHRSAGDGRSALAAFRLESKETFEEDLRALRRKDRAFFGEILRTWPRYCGEQQAAISGLERLALYLVSTSTHYGWYTERLLEWLRLAGTSRLWIVRFDDNLTFPARYAMLRQATEWLGAERESTRFIDVSDPYARMNYWLTLRLRLDLATEWAWNEGISSIPAVKAKRQSYLAYLQALKDEPYHRELDRFLQRQSSYRNSHTGLEREIARLLGIEETVTDRHRWEVVKGAEKGGKTDEALDTVFSAWFMRRYDQGAAARLLWRGMRTSEKVGAIVSFGFAMAAFVLFVLQAKADSVVVDLWRGWPGVTIGGWVLWRLQAFAQCSSLITAAWWSPKCFNFVLPRALFGSLLTWITLVFTSLPALWAVEVQAASGSQRAVMLRDVVQAYLSSQHRSYMIAVPICCFASVFVIRQIAWWTDARWIIVKRGVITTAKLFCGSLYWGILFGGPIRKLLEGRSGECARCLWPIAAIGAAMAALFGIIVELIWEDKAIGEPMEDPL